MLNEDLIKQVANSLSQRLLSGRPSPAKNSLRPLLIFGEEATNEIRQEAQNSLTDAIIFSATEFKPTDPQAVDNLLASSSVLVIAPLSLDLSSKIAHLQTDCATASLIIRALFDNKRVVAITEGMLNPTNYNNLRPGLARTVSELRNRLSDMGIIFLSLTELKSNLYQPVSELPEIPPKKFEQKERAHISLPVIKDLPISQHPTQQRLNINSSLNEFVEFLQSQPCHMEKDKPCDQCDICNTLGF